MSELGLNLSRECMEDLQRWRPQERVDVCRDLTTIQLETMDVEEFLLGSSERYSNFNQIRKKRKEKK